MRVITRCALLCFLLLEPQSFVEGRALKHLQRRVLHAPRIYDLEGPDQAFGDDVILQQGFGDVSSSFQSSGPFYEAGYDAADAAGTSAPLRVSSRPIESFPFGMKEPLPMFSSLRSSILPIISTGGSFTASPDSPDSEQMSNLGSATVSEPEQSRSSDSSSQSSVTTSSSGVNSIGASLGSSTSLFGLAGGAYFGYHLWQRHRLFETLTGERYGYSLEELRGKTNKSLLDMLRDSKDLPCDGSLKEQVKTQHFSDEELHKTIGTKKMPRTAAGFGRVCGIGKPLASLHIPEDKNTKAFWLEKILDELLAYAFESYPATPVRADQLRAMIHVLLGDSFEASDSDLRASFSQLDTLDAEEEDSETLIDHHIKVDHFLEMSQMAKSDRLKPGLLKVAFDALGIKTQKHRSKTSDPHELDGEESDEYGEDKSTLRKLLPPKDCDFTSDELARTWEYFYLWKDVKFQLLSLHDMCLNTDVKIARLVREDDLESLYLLCRGQTIDDRAHVAALEEAVHALRDNPCSTDLDVMMHTLVNRCSADHPQQPLTCLYKGQCEVFDREKSIDKQKELADDEVLAEHNKAMDKYDHQLSTIAAEIRAICPDFKIREARHRHHFSE